jgi:hypothetical protein
MTPATRPRTAVVALASRDGAGGAGFARRFRVAAARAAVFFFAVRVEAGRRAVFLAVVLFATALFATVFFPAGFFDPRRFAVRFFVTFFATCASGHLYAWRVPGRDSEKVRKVR